MQSSLKRPSERYKRKVLARGVGIEQAALEIGIAVEELRRWSARPELERPLLVPVQIEVDSPTRREIVVVLAGGVRVEGLTLEDVETCILCGVDPDAYLRHVARAALLEPGTAILPQEFARGL